MPSKTTKSAADLKKIARSKTKALPFDLRYQKLNQAQREAVDTIEGPVMVVAGPGTGKTEVLGMRVANILKNTQMRPSNILCLTFSVSGATAMRERLRQLIGPDAYGVRVTNFHSFCNDLIAQYPLVFEDWSALEQISDIERYRLVNQVIDSMLPDSKLVSRKQPYLRTPDLISRISQLKREGTVDLKQLKEIVKEYETQMASLSKPDTKQHEKNLLAAQKFKEFIDLFLAYQEELKNSLRYDYEDMILYVLEALREEPWLLQQLQEQYQYILVDEFQDTNGAQYQLIELLTDYSTVDHAPNLFVVGDDDQAIYRFQGATLKNIVSFHERFPEAPVIALTTSYRCSEPIIKAADSLIKNNEERLVDRIPGLDKTLTSSSDVKPIEPHLLYGASDAVEPWLIADLIKKQLKAGVESQEIAVIVQRNSELLTLFDVLSAQNIPVQMSGKADLLNNPYVSQLVAILTSVAKPGENGALATALGCSCFNLQPADLAKLFAYCREHEESLSELLLKLEDIAPKFADGWELSDLEDLIKARDVIYDLRNQLGSRIVVETVEQALKETGLLHQAHAGIEDVDTFDAIAFAALQTFFDWLKYRAYEQPTFNLQTLLSDLEYFNAPEYSQLRLTFDLPHLTESGVQLMTAHQSKGLEFDTVILSNFRHGHWDAKRSPGGVAVPEDLLFGWETDIKKFEKTQDERRLTFVAMTRAKRELIFTCPKHLSTGDRLREVSPSAFFAEAGTLKESIKEVKEPTKAATLLFEPVIIGDEAYRAFLAQRLETFALSVTALNHFLEDPSIFVEIDLLHTPQSKQPNLVYGNAVHSALKHWAVLRQQGHTMNEVQFVESFKTYLAERELLTKAEKDRLTKLGEENLPRYFKDRLVNFNQHVYKVEYPIKTHLPGTKEGEDIPIKGMIDRIDLLEPDSAAATIIDFKTGKPQSESKIREGDYFRQLAFYALLLENHSGLPIEPHSFVLDFVGEGTDHPIERVFQISEAEKRELKALVDAVWQKIIALDFTPL